MDLGIGVIENPDHSFVAVFHIKSRAAEWQIAVARMLALSEFYSNELN